ncbi:MULTISPECIES: metal-dependent transcriptional regulator [Caproicibacterium]|uniref:Metal-dependent transcriptional regulator n=1 Tax=Caproicibacterium argilliputei TaxID=3030016 RepID=A0AA97D6X8_9FIRM|nr:metal-dependent transcriptional regulator [Caproicibacterium argilliputei]WOC31376.1 metal-dependent transcriptional regulator [Caproicibacterium argilliputei]
MKIQESRENYLETILILQNRNGYVRSVDIAREMGFSKPSVSRAMSVLRKAGSVVMEDSGLITLTDSGRKIAENIYARHRLLTSFFISLGVNTQTAAEDACRVEHDISEETFERLQVYMEQSGKK